MFSKFTVVVLTAGVMGSWGCIDAAPESGSDVAPVAEAVDRATRAAERVAARVSTSSRRSSATATG